MKTNREIIVGQVRSGQVRSGQVRSGQVRSGQVRSGQVRSVVDLLDMKTLIDVCHKDVRL